MISDYRTKLIVDIIENRWSWFVIFVDRKDGGYRMFEVLVGKSREQTAAVSYLCVSIDSVAQHSVVCYLIGSARFTKRLIAHWSAALSLYLELSPS